MTGDRRHKIEITREHVSSERIREIVILHDHVKPRRDFSITTHSKYDDKQNWTREESNNDAMCRSMSRWRSGISVVARLFSGKTRLIFSSGGSGGSLDIISRKKWIAINTYYSYIFIIHVKNRDVFIFFF